MKTPILDKLHDERIFSFDLSESENELFLTESCHYHYTVALSKKEVLELIKELTKLASDMK